MPLPPPALVHAIVFSKDRAFQLQQLLRSLSQHVSHISVSVLYTTSPQKPGAGAAVGGDEAHCCDASYDEVRQTFPEVKFIKEVKGRFSEQFVRLVRGGGGGDVGSAAGAAESRSAAHPFVMFLVDDLVVYEPLDIAALTELLSTRAEVFSVHPKLHPAICWSHSAGKPCTRPPMHWTPLRECIDNGLSNGACYLFERKTGGGDWDYPWDLCGSIYRIDDALAVISAIQQRYGDRALANPNKVEANGHRIYQQAMAAAGAGGPAAPAASEASAVGGGVAESGEQNLSQRRDASASGVVVPAPADATAAIIAAAASMFVASPYSVCLEDPVLAVVTINRVQKTYKVPVYDAVSTAPSKPAASDAASTDQTQAGAPSALWQPPPCSGSIGSLEALRRRGDCEYDLDAYAATKYHHSSVHIGNLMLKQKRPGTGPCERQSDPVPPLLCDESHVAAGTLSDAPPTLTVLLPVFNGESWIGPAVRSILDQEGFSSPSRPRPSAPTLELLVVDDGSTDRSVATAWAAAGSGEARLRVVSSSAEILDWPQKEPSGCRNLGLVRALQTGLTLARARFVARMDADDIASRGRLRKQLDLMLRSKADDESIGGLAVVGGAITIFLDSDQSQASTTSEEEGHSGAALPSLLPPTVLPALLPSQSDHEGASAKSRGGSRKLGSNSVYVKRCVVHPVEPLLVRWGLWFSCCVAHPATLLRVSAVERVGGYRKEAAGAEDYDLWLRLANAHDEQGGRKEEDRNKRGLIPPRTADGSGGIANLPCVVLHHRRHAQNATKQLAERNALRSHTQGYCFSAAADGGGGDGNMDHAAPGQGSHDTAALRVAQQAMCMVLGRPIAQNHVRTMRDPQAGDSVDDFQGAVHLLQELEEVTLGSRFWGVAFESAAARDVLKADATSRIGELAVTAMSKHGSSAVGVWQMWATRSPEAQIAMLKGLLS